jgi:hypothetical protein
MKMAAFFSQLDACILMFLKRLYPGIRFGAVSLQRTDTPRFVISRIGNVGMRRYVYVRRTLCHKRTGEYHILDGRVV